MLSKRTFFIIAFLLFCGVSFTLLFYPENTLAANTKFTDENILDAVLEKYKTAAESWLSVIHKHAVWLFSILAGISLVWQMSQCLHRDFGEIVGELIRFIMFTGFYFWLLQNGASFASNIIDSMKQIGTEASGLPGLSPSSIVNLGFKTFDQVIKTIGVFGFSASSLGTIVIAIIVLLLLTLVGVNMLLQLCSAWILAYAGVIFLGFGGSRRTSDMAINYFKTVLGVGASLMTMTLLIGIGQDIIAETTSSLSPKTNMSELAILMVFSLTLFMLVDKLPPMVAGIITGAGISSMGIGAFGAGAAIGMAATGMGVAAKTMQTAAKSIATSAKIIGKGITGAATGAAGMKSAYDAAKGAIEAGREATKAKGAGSSQNKELLDKLAKPIGVTEVLKEMGKGAVNKKMDDMKRKFDVNQKRSAGGRLASYLEKQSQKR